MQVDAMSIEAAAAQVVAAVMDRRERVDRPYLVAFDGGSGAGKSTLAQRVAAQLDAVLIQADDFFAAHITDQGWAQRDAAARTRDVLDWPRLRADALEPLLAGKPAVWHPFDFTAGTRPDGTYPLAAEAIVRASKAVIVLDGAYSTRPELLDLIDLTVLVDAPRATRHARLAQREEAAFLAAWHARWDEAEAYYFAQVRPPEAFDLVIRSAGVKGDEHSK